MTLTYVYSDSSAVIGPLATYAEPHAYDLCAFHGSRLTVPHGWSVIQQQSDGIAPGPSHDDLMAIADAVREAASTPSEENPSLEKKNSLGRRGHLRAVPSQ